MKIIYKVGLQYHKSKSRENEARMLLPKGKNGDDNQKLYHVISSSSYPLQRQVLGAFQKGVEALKTAMSGTSSPEGAANTLDELQQVKVYTYCTVYIYNIYILYYLLSSKEYSFPHPYKFKVYCNTQFKPLVFSRFLKNAKM